MRHLRKLRSPQTWTDWDFEMTSWRLSREQYKAAPCSFCSDVSDTKSLLVKTSVVPNAQVKQGRLIFWFYHTSNAVLDSIWITFRRQDGDNFYGIHLRPVADKLLFTRYLAGVPIHLVTTTWLYALNTWHKVRVTWWDDVKHGGFAGKLERWNGEAWVDVIASGYDKTNYWSDVGGRVGFWKINDTAYIDDLEIYGVTS